MCRATSISRNESDKIVQRLLKACRCLLKVPAGSYTRFEHISDGTGTSNWVWGRICDRYINPIGSLVEMEVLTDVAYTKWYNDHS